MASHTDEGKPCHVDLTLLGVPTTSSPADAVFFAEKTGAKGVSVHAVVSSAAAHSSSVAPDLLSELKPLPMLSVAHRENATSTRNGSSGHRALQQKQSSLPPSLSWPMQHVKPCVVADTNSLSAGSVGTVTPDPLLTSQNDAEVASPVAFPVPESTPQAHAYSAAEEMKALPAPGNSNAQNSEPSCSTSVALDVCRQTSAAAAKHSQMGSSVDGVDNNFFSTADVSDNGDDIAKAFLDRQPSLMANAHRLGPSVPPPAETSSAFCSAGARSLPTRTRHLSSTNPAGREVSVDATGDVGGHDSSTCDTLLSSLPPQCGLNDLAKFFQNGLFLSLENGADTESGTMDAPMTPQSYSNLIQFRSDSAHQSLMSSRHPGALGGGVSPNSPANATFASASTGSVRGQPSQRGMGTTLISEIEGWTVSEMGCLPNLDENLEGVTNGLHHWEVSDSSYGTDSTIHASRSTPVVGNFTGPHGLAGGTMTSYSSLNLMSSYAQLCTSTVDPVDIPPTPTDLENLPSSPHAYFEEHRRHYYDCGDDDDDRGSGASDREEADVVSEVLETNTLVRARVVSAGCRSFYEVINEKYVLYDFELGKGSYSLVHLCYNLLDKRFYVAKVLDKVRLRRRQLGQHYGLIKMDQEITIMKQMQHKNIIGLREVIRDPNARYVFLILELAERREVLTMKDNGDVVPMEDGRTDYAEATVRHIIRGVLRALMYAHYLGIAHRDVKPSNILRTAQNTVKLADFGVSVLVGECAMQLHREGTVAFLAPELLLSNKVNVSRFLSPLPSTSEDTKGKAEPGEEHKLECLHVSTSSTAVATATGHAMGLAEEATALQENDVWDFEAPVNQPRSPSAPTASSVRPQQQQHLHHMPPPPTARHTTDEASKSRAGSNDGAAAASAGTSAIPHIADVGDAGPLHSLLASKSSVPASSVSSRPNVGAAAGDNGAIPQYISWLSSKCPQLTVDLFKGDVFSLGVTVFTMLMGRLPWRASSATSQLAAVLDEPDPFLRLYKEAYGDDYSWPHAMRESCLPILAFSHHSSYGKSAAADDSVTTCVGSCGAAEQNIGGREAERDAAVMPLRTRTVTIETGEDNKDLWVDTREKRPRFSTISNGCGATAVHAPPTKASVSDTPDFNRSGFLDAARIKLGMTPYSSNLSSSKAGHSPDVDFDTKTTLSGATDLQKQATTSLSGDAVGSQSAPGVVKAPRHMVAVSSESSWVLPSRLQRNSKSTVATQHETSERATPSSFWRSVVEGNTYALSESSVNNELLSTMILHTPGSGNAVNIQWNSSRVGQPHTDSVSATQRQKERSAVEERKNSLAHEVCQYPLPQGSMISEDAHRSVSNNISALSTAYTNTNTGQMRPMAACNNGNSGLVGVRPSCASAEVFKMSPASCRPSGSVVGTPRSSSASGKGDAEVGRRSKEGAPFCASASHVASAAGTSASPLTNNDGEGAGTVYGSCAVEVWKEVEGEGHHQTQASIDPSARSTDVGGAGERSRSEGAAKNGLAAASVSASQNVHLLTRDEEAEETQNEPSGAHVRGQVGMDGACDGNCLEREDKAGEEGYGRCKDEGGVVQTENDHSYADDESDNSDIYQQLYEEEHPCRPYTMSETRPLPAMGGEGGTRAVSAAAVDFVRCCLSLDPGKRRTVFELFHHPWIYGVSADKRDESWPRRRSRYASHLMDASDGNNDLYEHGAQLPLSSAEQD
ncbi:putative protein kinase [Leptomonas seymouri]|uniref:Protein kinase domain-containing protein n=1 Tax=Leptomonas seymouri TaxID=5684 RepID=A0A0N0P8L6_LEPSE|nr:putative protein kinase [Leptomonas seymouri]|eukprot:KPI90079.1 putative protein kinase [Leptomonas seymouri]